MEGFKVRQRIGQDGILYPEISVGLTDWEVEVMVIYQPVRMLITATNPTARLYSFCADDPIDIDRQSFYRCS